MRSRQKLEDKPDGSKRQAKGEGHQSEKGEAAIGTVQSRILQSEGVIATYRNLHEELLLEMPSLQALPTRLLALPALTGTP